jgi:hypothetical protein
MVKKILPIFLFVFLTSCNLLNPHNIKNDFKWKNKKLSNNTKVQFIFDPIVIKDFDATSSLKYYFQDSNKISGIGSIIKDKLSRRNFELTEQESKNYIAIDSLVFSDKAEVVSVLSNDASEILGDYEKNDINIKIMGSLHIHDTISAAVTAAYTFTDEPRESYLFKGLIAYTNTWVNLDKVMNNISNEFSYNCYLAIEKK